MGGYQSYYRRAAHACAAVALAAVLAAVLAAPGCVDKGAVQAQADVLSPRLSAAISAHVQATVQSSLEAAVTTTIAPRVEAIIAPKVDAQISQAIKQSASGKVGDVSGSGNILIQLGNMTGGTIAWVVLGAVVLVIGGLWFRGHRKAVALTDTQTALGTVVHGVAATAPAAQAAVKEQITLAGVAAGTAAISKKAVTRAKGLALGK
jgi:hypothetical protein